MNFVRHFTFQNNPQTTDVLTAFCLQAALTQLPSTFVRRNLLMIYPYLVGTVPVQQYLQPFDDIDPTYTTDGFLKAIATNLVMAAEPKQVDSPC